MVPCRDPIEQDLVARFTPDAVREDLRRLSRRHNPPHGVTPDEFLAWLQAYNECINHAPKPFKRMVDRDIKI